MHILTLGLAVSRPHPLGHLTLLPPTRLLAEAQLLGKLGLGPGLKTDWLEGWLQESPEPAGVGRNGKCRLGAGMPRTHRHIHITLWTSLKIHVQLNASLNKRKPHSAVWEPMERAGTGWVAPIISPVLLPPLTPAETRASL